MKTKKFLQYCLFDMSELKAKLKKAFARYRDPGAIKGIEPDTFGHNPSKDFLPKGKGPLSNFPYTK